MVAVSDRHNKENKTKTKNTLLKELNILDKIIDNDFYNSDLLNDVNKNKLKNGSKVEPTPVTIATIWSGKKGRIPLHEGLRVFVDTGCSHSLIVRKCCHKLIPQKEKKYATGSGTLTTSSESKIQFSLPEFSDKKKITWTFSVVDSKGLGYDIILGRDLLLDLKMEISFNKKTVSWEGIDIPMRDFNKLRRYTLNKKEFKAIIQGSSEPLVTQEATDRMIKILDSNYQKAELKEIV